MKLEKKYNHIDVEKGKNQKWIKRKNFAIHDDSKKPFSIILPPPNVTGKLHLGHAWDSFIQDTIIRYKKLEGFDVLFLPAMDHAGIATQSKIEQKLEQEGISKHELGREKFLEKAHEWKEEYANLIKKQWFKLGLALDYESERFTLDKDSNSVVSKVFIDLYNKGLIYKAKKPINWDPKLKTALSNIEVENKETNSKMFYVKYFLENSKDYLVVATTRVETIYSDVAIAYNPKDKSKINYKNKYVINPLNKQRMPIIQDDYIKTDFGSGFMKVSAHASEDIEIINKNKLEIKECIDENGTMNSLAQEFENLNRFEAREKIAQKLFDENLIEEIKEIKNNVSYSQRSNEVIEILVKDQWFLKMKHFSKLVLKSLESTQSVNFFPKRFEKVLKKWMEDAYDWTLSRQLWWGHRIPIWYKGNEIRAQIESPGKEWKQEEDVLDTWFSSGLAPFSFLGWPKENSKLKKFFPTSLLVTGYDIIFFWVARMYFFSLEFMNKIPFQDILFHGLIRDSQGRKMSKSLGNGIDPMEVIDQFGSDSLRWFLLTNSSPGLDINYSEEKIKQSWSLNNKLWNISRFIFMMEDDESKTLTNIDKWIYNKLAELKKLIDKSIKKYDFTIIGKEISNFVYKSFSSWYIEFSKTNPNKNVALDILKKLLIIIHPFLPFISDELYLKITNEEILDQESPIVKTYKNTLFIDHVITIIGLIRSFRSDFNLSKNDIVEYWVENNEIEEEVINLVNKITDSKLVKNNGIMYSEQGIKINILLAKEMIDKEIHLTNKEIEKIKLEVQRSENILNNKKFLERAKEEKVKEEKNKFDLYKNKLKELENKIKSLKGEK